MDELVKLISERTGIPAEQAHTVVETVLGYLKEKLPAPVAGQIDGLLAGAGANEQASQVIGALGGLFGRK
ncbi:MAG: DUF2267 domain-containing protein [Chloroflexi bacterium]|nr:DUF2267 domain-containing protein [Chloroflexota bacterium]